MRFLLYLCATLLVSVADLYPACIANDRIALADSPQSRRQRVLIIVRDDCPQCEAQLKQLRSPGGTFELMKARGWMIATTPDSHIQIVNRAESPEFTTSLSDTDYQVVRIKNGGLHCPGLGLSGR